MWRCLRRDCGGKIEGLPLLWVGLPGEGECTLADSCVVEAHDIAGDRSKMRKRAAEPQRWCAIGEAVVRIT